MCLSQLVAMQLEVNLYCDPFATITLANSGRPENCSAGGGGGGEVTWTPAEGGGGGLEKWGSVSGPLFCVRTDVGAEILARKSFFHQ